MTERLYYHDPYLKEIEAVVISCRNGEVELDKTIFYPGGGGQECDTGSIDGIPVLKVYEDNEGKCWHSVSQNPFVVGQKVKLKLNWERRYDLMKAHTAEHLFFGRLSELSPQIEVTKVFINSDKKSFFIKGNVDWDTLKKAEKETNRRILLGQKVSSKFYPASEARVFPGLRVKWDKLNAEELVRIVGIGDLDYAACSGTHLSNINEIGFMLVTRFVRAKGESDFEIEYLVGEKAVEHAIELSTISLILSEELKSIPENLLSALRNLREENARYYESLKECARKILTNMQPEKTEKYDIYSNIFYGLPQKELIEGTNKIIENPRAVVLFANVGDKVSIIVAAHSALGLNCIKILNAGLELLGGKGGGKVNYAMGGANDKTKISEAMERMLTLIKST